MLWLIGIQMAVGSDWDDNTWKIHLDGYISLLQHSRHETVGNAPLDPLELALQFVRDDTAMNSSTTVRDYKGQVILLLSIFTLRLRNLVQFFCRLTGSERRPRKLDVQRLKVLLKRLLGDLKIVLPVSSLSGHAATGTIEIEHAALRVITGSMLIECGRILDVDGAFDTTRQYAKLSSLVGVATADTIAKSVMLCPGIGSRDVAIVTDDKIGMSGIATTSTPLSLMWPLFAAGVWASSNPAQRGSARDALFYLGRHYCIPRALHLVCIP